MKEKIQDLSEDFRPKTFKEVVGNEKEVEAFVKGFRTGNIRKIMFAGPKGIGKTSLIEIAIEELKKKYSSIRYEYTNAGDARKVDDIREKIIPFLIQEDEMLGIPKVLFMDEWNLTPEAEEALKTPLEKTKIYIFAITNNFERIIPAIQDRFTVYKMNPVKPEAIKKRLVHICQTKEIEYEDDALEIIIEESQGSVRKAIKSVEKLVAAKFPITVENIVTAAKNTETIKSILTSIVQDQFGVARKRTFDLLKSTSLTARSFLKEMNFVVSDMNIFNDAFKARIFSDVAKADYYITVGSDPGIQINGLLGNIRSICTPLISHIRQQSKQG